MQFSTYIKCIMFFKLYKAIFKKAISYFFIDILVTFKMVFICFYHMPHKKIHKKLNCNPIKNFSIQIAEN